MTEFLGTHNPADLTTTHLGQVLLTQCSAMLTILRTMSVRQENDALAQSDACESEQTSTCFLALSSSVSHLLILCGSSLCIDMLSSWKMLK